MTWPQARTSLSVLRAELSSLRRPALVAGKCHSWPRWQSSIPATPSLPFARSLTASSNGGSWSTSPSPSPSPSSYKILSLFNPTKLLFRQNMHSIAPSCLPSLSTLPSPAFFLAGKASRKRRPNQAANHPPRPASQAPPRHVSQPLPPDDKQPRSSLQLNPDWVIGTIIALNVIVFLAWQYANISGQKYNDPRGMEFMLSNFCSGWWNISNGRLWTLVTACFSQSSVMHLTFNMLSLGSFGAGSMAMLGSPRNFIAFYLVSGALACVGGLAWQLFVNPSLGRTNPRFSQGASGSIFALLSFIACIRPRDQFTLFFIIPIRAWVIMPAILAFDLFNSISTRDTFLDSPVHLSGALIGLLWGLRMRRRLPRHFIN
ncbi:unnamed protein product [Sympodiomycopsis kandeliae]